MLYILENTDMLPNELIDAAFPLLSQQRRKQLSQYSMGSDRINCCVAYLLLRYALRKEYGYDGLPEFEFVERGKPRLKDRTIPYFNLSHCKNAVACILSEADTAVDIMDIRAVKPATLRRCCSEEERAAIQQSNTPDRTFTALWTRKECYSKLTGKGLLMDFRAITDELPEVRRIKTRYTEHYICSYVCKEETEAVYPDISELLTFDELNSQDKH